MSGIVGFLTPWWVSDGLTTQEWVGISGLVVACLFFAAVAYVIFLGYLPSRVVVPLLHRQRYARLVQAASPILGDRPWPSGVGAAHQVPVAANLVRRGWDAPDVEALASALGRSVGDLQHRAVLQGALRFIAILGVPGKDPKEQIAWLCATVDPADPVRSMDAVTTWSQYGPIVESPPATKLAKAYTPVAPKGRAALAVAAGLSVGETVALVAAGQWDEERLLSLAALRGHSMPALAPEGREVPVSRLVVAA